MKSEDEHMDLQKEAPNLTAISKENAFEIPEGYFENLNEQILNQVKIDELVENKNSFNVPTNYFEHLASQIQSEIYLDNLKPADTNNSGFNVPIDYFENAEKRIQKNIIPKAKKAKFSKLQFVRYAAAACILLTTTLGIYFNVKYTTSVDQQLSKIPASEIETYLNQHTDGSDLPMLMENIDEDTNLGMEDFKL